MQPNVPFLLRYENYLLPAPGPETFEVNAEGPGPPVLHWRSWQPQLAAGLQTRLLDLADLARVQELALAEELNFFGLPTALTPPTTARPDGDWPYFTLRYGGRTHACGGPAAGVAYPALGRLQELLMGLYEQYVLLPSS